MIQLFNQDCMTAMKNMKDNAFDLAIVDPPYGIHDKMKTTATQKKAGCGWAVESLSFLFDFLHQFDFFWCKVIMIQELIY